MTRKKKNRQILPSILTSNLKYTLLISLVLGGFIIANTSYLLINRVADSLNWRFFAAGKTSLPQLFQIMVLTHTGVGLILITLMAGFAIAHLRKVWRRRHNASIFSGIGFVAVGLILAITGLFILTDAASRDNQWAWWAHVVCGALAIAGYITHRFVSYTRPVGIKFKRFFLAVVALVLVLVTWHGFTNRGIIRTQEAQIALDKGLYNGPGAKNRDVTKFSESPFVPTGFVPPGSPFFPSAATTTSVGYFPSRIITRDDLGSMTIHEDEIKEFGFVKDTRIGAETCNRCHADIVDQWASSAHRFASFNNPFYEATIEDLRKNATQPNAWVEKHIKSFPETKDRVGMVKSKWCSGCHDPALMLAGDMDKPINRNSPEAQAGLTCLACHAIDHIHNATGNGNYNIADEQEDPYLFANAKKGSMGALIHDAIIKAKPTVHKRQMLKPFFKKSEYCATCHKVSLTEPVNNYRWFRGQDEFDNWHDSGVALNASRTFYLPAQKRLCQDCHMPPEPAILGDVAAKNGFVRSHRFLAVNTALPFLRGDIETIKKIESFLQDEKLSVDIFALKTESMKKPVMAINRRKPALSSGEKVTLDVVVRNKGVGHTFPGGTNDSNEGWLEVSILDENGDLLANSGALNKDGHVDPMAHVYKALIVDKDGQPIHRRNAQDIHVTVFANVIGPGTADIAHYEFTIPNGLTGSSIKVQARLLWRKFDRKYTEFAFHANREGFKQYETVPDLPVTVIASDEISLEISKTRKAIVTHILPDEKSDWMRYNDYGIGLLLQDDTRGASIAFQQVAKLRPDLLHGSLNLAKVAVRDGNIDKAYQYLKKCEDINPGDAQVAWVWGVVLQEDGLYENAVSAYRRVLEQFPEDRAVWRNLGRTLYLNQQYEEALQAFEQVLAIDPEDAIAHYHRMLCFRAIGEEEMAKIAEEAYKFYQIDESAKEITRAYRLKDKGANLMAQKIRTHILRLQN